MPPSPTVVIPNEHTNRLKYTMAKEKDPLLDTLVAAAAAGVDAGGVTELKGRAAAAPGDLADAAEPAPRCRRR